MTMLHGEDLTSPSKGEVDRAERCEASSQAVGRGSSIRFGRTKTMTTNARRLRGNPSDVEILLWKALRRNQLAGLSFRRQHPIGRYVLDFYCPAVRLAIEVDGGQHNLDTGRQRDRVRDEWLSAQGIHMLRFWNNEVLSNLQGVLETIANAGLLDQLPIRDRTPTRREDRVDLPLSGGGEDPHAS